MLFDGILHGVVDVVHELFQRFAVVGFENGFPIAFDVHFAVLKSEAVSRRQFEYAFEECFRQDTVLECEIVFQCFFVYFPFETGVFQNALDFGAVNQVSVLDGIVKRLDAEKVSCAKKCLCLAVPDNESEHAAQFRQQVFAVFFVAVEQDFCVRMAAHDMTLCDKVFTEFLMVVDFPVECDDHIPVFVVDGLCAALQVDDAQTAEAHGNAVVNMFAAAVRTAVDDFVHHVFQYFFGSQKTSCKAANAAHRCCSSFYICQKTYLSAFYFSTKWGKSKGISPKKCRRL